MFTRRQFLAATACSALSAQRQRRPNIVFIMADDLGIGDLSCYGQRHFRTPNIDRIGAEGIQFSQAYSGCTVCAPARSVLMTGFHMGHTSVRSNPGGVPLQKQDVTVAELLKNAGYATGGFGKWGLGDNGTEGAPWHQGFDEFVGYLHQVHAHWFYPEFIYDNDKRLPLKGNKDGQRTTYSHDVIADRCLDFIRRHKDEPFFCYVPFTIPHWELLVPEDSLNQYKGKYPEWAYVDPRKHYADQPHGRAAYAAMITRMDRDVGRILNLLEELKLADNTIVFFTSDNGAALPIKGEDFFRSTLGLRGHKQNFYEGGIRVPMVARWPGRIPKGSKSDMPWAFWDVLPTMCEIAGVSVPHKVDGRSVLPALTGRKQEPQPFLYWELPTYNGKTGTFADEQPMQAGRMGDWKIVRPKANGPLELYNLASDPYEKNDVASQNPKIVEKMSALLKASRVPPRPQPHPPMDWEKS